MWMQAWKRVAKFWGQKAKQKSCGKERFNDLFHSIGF
jgi:hypothetical protein